jgi:hypothetical protein
MGSGYYKRDRAFGVEVATEAFKGIYALNPIAWAWTRAS